MMLLMPLLNFGQSYLGKTTKQVNFRSESNSQSNIISTLNIGRQLFIISIETENDFYNVIDIETDKEGYVHKSFVRLGEIVTKNKQGFFTPTGKTSNYNSELKIYNNTNKTLTLKLNEQYYFFTPKETKNINVSPGIYDFRASAPGVRPNIGTENLVSNQGYSWEFYIFRSYN